MEDMTEEILPCPFCGGEGIVKCIPYGRKEIVPGQYDCWVSCSICHIERPSTKRAEVVHNRQDAIAAWNRRVTPMLDKDSLFIIKKALQRYRIRIEEVSAMGWYDNPEVTRQEVARVDAILKQLESPL